MLTEELDEENKEDDLELLLYLLSCVVHVVTPRALPIELIAGAVEIRSI
jgi:hypothetical protein